MISGFWDFELFYFAIFNVEDFGIVVRSEDVGKVLAVGIGNKDLPEIIALYHLYNPFDAFCVESVEDVIEQQDGLVAICHL